VDGFARLITLFIHFFGVVDKNDLLAFQVPDPWHFAIIGPLKTAKNCKITGKIKTQSVKPLKINKITQISSLAFHREVIVNNL
jgi:hypothetical protein